MIIMSRGMSSALPIVNDTKFKIKWFNLILRGHCNSMFKQKMLLSLLRAV